MKINSPRQLKDLINNMAKKNNVTANSLLQNYMMERFLERISISPYKDNFILKGGFLISSIIGVDLRSTMDMDTTLKGLSVNRDTIENILNEIIAIDVDDKVIFLLKGIKNIHDISEYEDFRVAIEAQFLTIKVNMKIDITTGDIIVPKEIDYSFDLMFEDRSIDIKAYNLYTILAEKIESVLARNISNTRARDYYDIYMLLSLENERIDKFELKNSIVKKAEERNTLHFIENSEKYIHDLSENEDIFKIWNSYKDRYPYAKGIDFHTILGMLKKVL